MRLHSLAKTKTSHILMKNKRILAIIAVLGLVGFGTVVTTSGVLAQYQEEIDSLTNQNTVKQGSLNQLGSQASSLQDAISKLQAQINSLQSQITSSETARDQTIAKINKAEADLAQQRTYLGDSLKALYVDGGISSLEMLASSQDINHFVDQEQYQNSIQGQIQRTLDSIKQLRVQLDSDKTNLERMIADLSSMRAAIVTQQAEQNRLLSLNQAQQSELDSQIKANSARVTDLQAKQALINAGLNGGKPGVGVNCGGGYPGHAKNVQGGTWGCNYGLDEGLDNWGMYNRECVSYTAFKVSASGRYMPAWGSIGRGNANQWDENARAEGIPVDRSPRKGDVAVSNSGDYGHVMYVEQVASDGSIYVSDYNQQWDGRYRAYWVSPETVSGKALVFIHF